MRLGAVSAALLLTGCDYFPIEKAKDAVRGELKDPDSAKFEMVRVGPSGAVCGWVNARNSYGGYAGNTAFMAGGPFGLPRFSNGNDLVGLASELNGKSATEAFWAEWACNCDTFQQRASEATRSGKPMIRCPGDPPPLPRP